MLVQPGYTNNKCRRDLRILSNGRASWRVERQERRAAPATAAGRGYADRQDDPQAITISDDAGAGS
jgi:hypothetical protein